MFDYNNLIATDVIQGQSIAMTIAQASLITLWGFIGLESATTPAGSVMNPGITIPRAIIVGTGIVALIYLLNSVAIMGLIPGGDLHVSTAPYTDAARYLFGGNWHIFISLMATIICVGTLNAWILTSGQISLGLANDKLLPFIFSKKNIKGAPYASILISCLCMLPLILLMANKDMGKEVEYAIEVSVTSFLFIYLLCSLTNLRLILQESGVFNFGALVSIIAVLFCLWVLSESHYTTILCSGIFTLSGLPIYCFWYKRQDRLS
jgi:APA family basic amino acid/polyamine antiporter